MSADAHTRLTPRSAARLTLKERAGQFEAQARTLRLLKFADQALDLMEREQEWSAGTLDDIASLAYQSGLARNNDDTGLFERTP